MRKLTLVPPDATANPVYLTAAAIGSLIQSIAATLHTLLHILIKGIRKRNVHGYYEKAYNISTTSN